MVKAINQPRHSCLQSWIFLVLFGIVSILHIYYHRTEIFKIARVNDKLDDKLIQKLNNNEICTVKSINQYAMVSLINNEEYRIGDDWMQIWKMKIPQIVKIFLWSYMQGCLPTHSRLQYKGVMCYDNYSHTSYCNVMSRKYSLIIKEVYMSII